MRDHEKINHLQYNDETRRNHCRVVNLGSMMVIGEQLAKRGGKKLELVT